MMKLGFWGDFSAKYDTKGSLQPPSSSLGKFVASPVTQGVGMLGLTAIPVGLSVKSYFDSKKQQSLEHQLNVHKKMLDIISSAHRAQLMKSLAPDIESPRTQAAVMSSEPANENPSVQGVAPMPKVGGLLPTGVMNAGKAMLPSLGHVANGAMALSFGRDLLTPRPPPSPIRPNNPPMMQPAGGEKLGFLAPLLAGAARMGAAALPRLMSAAPKAMEAVGTAANAATVAGAAMPKAPRPPDPMKLSVQTMVVRPSLPGSGPGITKGGPKPISQTPRGSAGAPGAFTPDVNMPKVSGMVADTISNFSNGAASAAGTGLGNMLTRKTDLLPSKMIRANDRPLSDIR